MRRVTRPVLLPALIALLLIGCHAPRLPVIAVIPQTTAQELWESEHAGVEAEARARNWHIYWNGPSREGDIGRQMQMVDHAIATHVSGLVLSPIHSIALLSLIHSAIDHHIPTVILGSPLQAPPSALLHYVLNDEAADGRLAASRAAVSLHAGDTVAILGVDPGILASVARAGAIEATLRAHAPGVHIEEHNASVFNFIQTEEIAEQSIHSTPSLRVIITLSLTQTRATLQALLDAHKTSTIRLIGCGQDLDLMAHLRSGEIDAIIAEDTRSMGRLAIEHLQSEMDRDTSAPFQSMVEPILVTRENADSAPVQQVLDMNWNHQ